MSDRNKAHSGASSAASSKKSSFLKPVLIVLAVVLLAAGAGYAAARIQAARNGNGQGVIPDPEGAAPSSSSDTEGTDEPLSPDPEADSQTWGRRVEYEGVSYKKINNLRTILFLGVDNAGVGVQTIGKGGKADSIALFILDPAEKTIQMMSVSRDTMVPVDVYDEKGVKLYTGTMQINMQYAYGDSAKRSCLLMERRVGELIRGMDIDGYFSITMDGLPAIVDGIGGLRLTMPEDYTDVDPAYIKGAEVTLDGKQALHFVRHRDTKVTGSNDERMDRNAWLMGELFAQMSKGKFSISRLLDLAGDYITTDVDADTLKAFTTYKLKDDRYVMPGATVEGEAHDEYYVDQDALDALLLKLYYEAE